MWISARTAVTLATAALVLVMFAMAAPFIPAPHLPSLPEERTAVGHGVKAEKFGAASAALSAPERVRAQRMTESGSVPEGAARLGGRIGNGPAAEPSSEAISRLVALLRDARTVANPRASDAEPTWVVRFVRDGHKVDVMVDPASDRLVVALDGAPVGAYRTVALHREIAALGTHLFPAP